MPYIVEESQGQMARQKAQEKPPFGPGFTVDDAQKVGRLELWGSSFSDPGGDWCEWRAFDAEGKLLAKRRSSGY